MWRLTLREIGFIFEGVSSRMNREHNDRAWAVWHIEALARVKKLPKLADMTVGTTKKSRRQTADEQIAIAHMWTAATTRH